MKVTTDGCLFGAWVADQLTKTINDPKDVLDIGSGTGLLSLMLAQVTTSTNIDALEINEAASMEASENFFNSQWSDRLNCFHLPLQNYEVEIKYEVIITNPPFFNKNQKGQQPAKNQALHNDHLSVEDLTSGIERNLSEKGCAFILFPEKEMDECINAMKSKKLFLSEKVVVRNKEGGAVFRLIGKFSRSKSQSNTTELIIKDSEGQYTDAFNKLLQEYYLN